MKRMLFVPVLLGLTLIITSALSAQAAPEGSNLHGEYSLIGTRTCVQTFGGADFIPPNYSLPPAGGTTRTTHYNAILQLFGNGTGELSAKALQINHNSGSLPTGTWKDNCGVAYQGLEDGTIQMNIANCLSENTWPPPLVNTFNSFSSFDLSVTVSANGDTLLLSDVKPVPDEEIIWACARDSSGQADCNQILFPQKRICVRSFTAIRLSPRP